MSFSTFLLIIISCIITVTLFYNAEKNNDYVSKIWFFMLGVITVIITIAMLKFSLDKPDYSDNYEDIQKKYINYNYNY